MRAEIRLGGVIWLAALSCLGFLAADADAYVYWGNGTAGTLGRAANDGTHVEPSFISGQSGPFAIAVDSGHLYWANTFGHTIGRASISGADVEPEFIKLPYEPSGVAVDASHVYWANGSGGFIGRSGIDGSSPNPEFLKKVGTACGLAVDSGHIYWAGGAVGSGYVGRAPLSGGSFDPEYVSMTPVKVLCGVAVNPSNIFWSDFGQGAGTNIGRANLSTGTGADISFIGAALGPCGIDALGSELYWANSGTATIGRANTDSTGVEYEWIHTGAEADQICGIAVDSLAPPPPPSGGGGTDTTPPQTKIKGGPGKILLKGKAKFSFSSSEPGSTFTCKLDKRKSAPCRSPKTYKGLKPGRHTFSVWATDAAGNKDQSPAKRGFRVPTIGAALPEVRG